MTTQKPQLGSPKHLTVSLPTLIKSVIETKQELRTADWLPGKDTGRDLLTQQITLTLG